MIIVYSEKSNLHNKSNEVRDDILFDKVIIEPGASWVDQATWNRGKQLLEFIFKSPNFLPSFNYRGGSDLSENEELVFNVFLSQFKIYSKFI